LDGFRSSVADLLLICESVADKSLMQTIVEVMGEAGAMSDRFQLFEVLVKQRGRRWWWSVWTTDGALVMDGLTSNRLAARYEAHKALFLLLASAPYRLRPSTRAIQANLEARGRRSTEF
jgi:hypothetical protein